MSEVSEVNGVEIADIEAINGIDGEDIESINGVDFVTGFSNVYALRQLVSPQTGSMQVANPSSYHFESGGTDQAFSISAWVQGADDPPKRFRVATKGRVAGGGLSTSMEWSLSSGAPPWYAPTDPAPYHFKIFGDTGGSIYIERLGGAMTISGSWNHLVATYDAGGASSGMKLYLNGSDVTSTTAGNDVGSYSSLADSGLPVTIGSIPGNSDRFRGYIDEVSIWTKELSSADVADIYSSGTPTDISASGSLLSWWRMGDNNGGTGTTITDVQGTGNGSLDNANGATGAGKFSTGDGISSEKAP